MYGYAEIFELTPEELLQKVTQEQIFEFILKEPVIFGARYCSPFRVDNNPDCRFETRPDGTIVFVDWGERNLTGKTHRSCFGMIMDTYKVNLTQAMKIVCSEFGLSTAKHDYLPVDKVLYDKREEQDSNKTIMTFERKEFSKSDTIFWSQYLIRPEHLIQDGHSSVRRFTKKNYKGFKIITPYKSCFVFDFLDAYKFYQPYADERYRWITNCDEDDIGNFDNLPPTGDELIIQKSYKDHRVLRNLDWGLNVVWFQNEGCVPSDYILKNLSERFKKIILFYDNDDGGIAASEKLTAIFNQIRDSSASSVYLPKRRKHKQLFGNYLKDPSDFLYREGKQDLITVLKKIGINGKNT